MFRWPMSWKQEDLICSTPIGFVCDSQYLYPTALMFLRRAL